MKLAKCIKVFSQRGSAVMTNGVKQNTKSGPMGPGIYFDNKGHGKGLISHAAELLLFIEVDEKMFYVPIDKQFRKKFQKPGTRYATLSKDRLDRIGVTMPTHVDIEETGEIGQYPYRVMDQSINLWFSKI